VKHNGFYSVTAAAATFAFVAWIPATLPAQATDVAISGPAPSVFQAAGPNPASIQSAVDAFRAALGGVNNGNVAGPLTTGRREINWDGGGSSATSIVPTPFEGFLVTRGGLFKTPGTGFVQAPPAGLADTFGRPQYATNFAPFSPLRLFAPTRSNVTDATFFIPGGGNVAATTTGFGVVFSDVDRPDGTRPGARVGGREDSTLIRYFDASGRLIYSSAIAASTGTGTFSFIGIVYPLARIGSVRIITGDAALELSRGDAVVMDDFIYGEPQPR
jgi:hypothetical protein